MPGMGGVVGGASARPLAAVCASFLAGAFVGCAADPVSGWLVAAGALAVALWRPGRALALALAVGLVRGAVHERPRTVEIARDEFAATVVATGPSGALLRLPGASAPSSRANASEPSSESGASADGRDQDALALVSLRGEAHRGDRIVAFGSLHAPLPRLNPGGRDQRQELAVRGIGALGSAEVVRVLERGPRLFRWLDRVRQRFAERASLLCTTPERAALVAALGVGDRSLISPELEDELSASGLVHLLASSGLHLAVAALLVRTLAARAWLRTPFAGRVRPAAFGAVVALPFVALEVLLLGAPWPAVRAGLAAAAALFALALGRRSDGITSLLFGAAVCAAVDPAATHDLALQLSLLGILGLICLTVPLRELLPWPRPLHPRPLRALAEHGLSLACATLAATLCTAPLLAAAFHRVSLVSVLANALGLLPGLAAIPLATLALALDPLGAAALPFWWAADLLSGATLSAAGLFAAVPFAAVAVAAPGVLVCLLWYAAVALLGGAPEPALQRPRTRLLRASIPFGALALLGFARAAAPRFASELRLTFLAVGQGDATLVQLPGGHAVLVDAGGDVRAFPSRLDPGLRDVVPALAELGVSRLDLVVLTHPHPDHAGGLATVLDRVSVGELWMTAPAGDAIGDFVRRKALQRGVPVREPEPRVLGGVRLEVLSGAWDPALSANDNSIVLRLVHGATAALLSGDVEALAEADLAQGTAPLDAQLLKAGHHGSRTSSTDAFLRRVHPRDVVYCAGARNQFGFPHPEVVERTEALGARTFSTAMGAVIAESDGRELRVRRWSE